MPKPIRTVLIALVALLATGCGTATISLHMRQPTPLVSEPDTTLLAGVGRADITPRPGMPTAGYSMNGNSAKGFRTRLCARAIYLKSAERKPVALVQCDLLSGSELVHRRVGELVAGKTDLDMGGIMISGSHTHSGPGNLLGSNFYLMNAGNKGGLDLKFFDFVTGQIANAIVEAYSRRQPARIATGSLEVYGFTRNRNIEAYRANGNAEALKAKDVRRAVNPMMHMIRVDCLDGKSGTYLPVGAFTSYSIHGTGVASANDLYSGDVFAYMERELEWKISRKHGNTGFVHAVVNGTHGDNAPDVSRQGYKEARRVGIGLGQKAVVLFEALAPALSADVKVQAAIREIDFYRNGTVDGISICDPPRVGNTLLAGVADGGPTPVLNWLPFFREGSHRWIFTGGCQGNKRIALGPFQSLLAPREEFPHVITFQAVQVGEMMLLPLPFELTMEAGRRIAEACRKSALESGLSAKTTFVPVSVSNGYTGYCTTPEEYRVQRYEGGHTLYGPDTGPYIAAQESTLVKDLIQKGEIRDMAAERSFKLTGKVFYREYEVSKGRRAAHAEPVLRRGKGEEDFWSFSWADVPPSLLDFHRPLVSIEYSRGGSEWRPLETGGIRVDDAGYDLAAIFTEEMTVAGLGIYEARWYNPPAQEGQSYRFRIEPRPGQGTLFSAAFK